MLASAAFVTALATVLTIGATNRLDNERAEREARAADERSEEEAARDAAFDWRTRIVDDGMFPGATLTGLDLGALYASDVDLSGARADEVDLGGAGLPGVRFDGASLRRASLRDAQLIGGSFNGADLTDADLIGASIRGVDLRFATLHGADLREVHALEADVRGVDLRETRIDESFGRLACWDDATLWPEGYEPRGVTCAGSGADRPPPASERWRIDAYVSMDANPYVWRPEGEVRGTSFAVEVVFSNFGRSIVEDVILYVSSPETDAYIATIRHSELIDGNHLEGWELPDEAIQDRRRDVNLNLGHYGGGGVGYVLVKYDLVPLRELGCDPVPVTIDVSATPRSREAVTDRATATWVPPGC